MKDWRAGAMAVWWFVIPGQVLTALFFLGAGEPGWAWTMVALLGVTLWMIIRGSRSRWRVENGQLFLASTNTRPAMEVPVGNVSAVERVVRSPPATPDTRAEFQLVLTNGSRLLLGTQIIDHRYGYGKLRAVTEQEKLSAQALADALQVPFRDG